jgi:hypothetical protein
LHATRWQFLSQLARGHAIDKVAPVKELGEAHRRSVAPTIVPERVGSQQWQNEDHLSFTTAGEELGNVHEHVVDAAAEDDIF